MSKLLDALKRAEHLRKERQAQDRSAASAPSGDSMPNDPEIEAIRQRLDELEASRKLSDGATIEEVEARKADFAAALAALEGRLAELAVLKTAAAATHSEALKTKQREFESAREALEQRVALIEAELVRTKASHASETAQATERAEAQGLSLQAKLVSLEKELLLAKQATEESRRRAAAAQATQTDELNKRADALAAQINDLDQARLRVEAEIAHAESDFHTRASHAEQQLREAEQNAQAALKDKELALSALESGVAARLAAVESANLRLRTRTELDTQAAQVARARLAAEDRLRVIENDRARGDPSGTSSSPLVRPESRTGAYNPLLDTTASNKPASRRTLSVVLVCASMLAIGFWIADYSLRRPTESVVSSRHSSTAMTRVQEINKATPQKFEPVTLKLDRQLRRTPR
jgi:IgA-specific serine endopeptidase